MVMLPIFVSSRTIFWGVCAEIVMVCVPVGFVTVFSLTDWVHPADTMSAVRSNAMPMSARRNNMDLWWDVTLDRGY